MHQICEVSVYKYVYRVAVVNSRRHLPRTVVVYIRITWKCDSDIQTLVSNAGELSRCTRVFLSDKSSYRVAAVILHRS